MTAWCTCLSIVEAKCTFMEQLIMKDINKYEGSSAKISVHGISDIVNWDGVKVILFGLPY